MRIKVPGIIALLVATFAGFVDLVALAVWTPSLEHGYGLDTPTAGLLVTTYLAAGVIASLALAPLAPRLNGRVGATIGFGVAALAGYLLSIDSPFAVLLLLHVLAGLGAGAGLTFTLSTVGRTNEPQRLYGWGQAAVGVLGLAFQPIAQIVAGQNPHAFFIVLGTVSALAFVLSLLLFPTLPKAEAVAAAAPREKVPGRIWFGVVGMSLMAIVQSMIFAYVAQVAGTPAQLGGHGFESAQIAIVLSLVGAVNIVFALLASVLRNRIPARWVVVIGPLVQALIATGVMIGHPDWVYVVATLLFVGVVIFVQTFVFGFMSRLDRSGRVVGGTPAMTMIGGAIGPVVGGALIGAGIPNFGAVAVAAGIFGVVSCVLMVFFGRGGAPSIATQPEAVAQGAVEDVTDTVRVAAK